jgi:hypothetical protein
VKRKALRGSLAGIVIGIGALIAPCQSVDAQIATDECAKELLLSYFPEPIVTETLKKFKVPEDKWTGITRSLSAKDKEIVKLIEQKAATMNPNPLKDVQHRQAAVKLFRDTLLQVFTDALKENGIQDTSQIQAMLDDIQQQKAKKFAMCLERQKAKAQQEDTNDEASVDESDEQEDSDQESNSMNASRKNMK